MNVWLNILLIVLPLVFGIYSFFLSIPTTPKIVVWFICLVFFIFGVYRVIQEQQEKQREARDREYQTQLLEEQKLRDLGRPQPYINGLGKSPLLKEYFNVGKQYTRDNQFQQAISEYNKILFHLNSIAENKVAAHILIGNCYYDLSNLDEAEKHYQHALSLSKKVTNKFEKLGGRSTALGNIGFICCLKVKLDEALKYSQDAVKIYRKIGDRQGEAFQLSIIGAVYNFKGDLDEALKYFQDALKINKEIEHRPGEADQLCNIGVIYLNKAKLDKALKYLRDALKIHRKIGDRQGEATDLGNIGVFYRDKDKHDRALKYLQSAMKINKEIEYRQGEANDFYNIGVIYRTKGDLDKALKYLQDSLFILTRYNLVYRKEYIENAIQEIEAHKIKNQGPV